MLLDSKFTARRETASRISNRSPERWIVDEFLIKGGMVSAGQLEIEV